MYSLGVLCVCTDFWSKINTPASCILGINNEDSWWFRDALGLNVYYFQATWKYDLCHFGRAGKLFSFTKQATLLF